MNTTPGPPTPRSTDIGRVAIVTGAAAGVGRATAVAFGGAGTLVAAADIDEGGARETIRLVQHAGGQGIAVPTDVADEEAVRHLVDEVVSTFGRVDVLHNNAAALGAGTYGRDTRIDELDVDVWETTMAVNLRGVMLGCKHVIPVMRRGGGGSIVNTVSVAAFHGGDDHAAYGVSKAGVVSLTRYVASMYGPDAIRCNAVAPGLIMSETARAALSDHQLAEFEVERALPWPADPEDIANIVVWLASDDARCITGQTVVADSGILTRRPRDVMAQWETHLQA